MADLIEILQKFWKEKHNLFRGELYDLYTNLKSELNVPIIAAKKKIDEVSNNEKYKIEKLGKDNERVIDLITSIERRNYQFAFDIAKEILNGTDDLYPSALKKKIKLFEFNERRDAYLGASAAYDHMSNTKDMLDKFTEALCDVQDGYSKPSDLTNDNITHQQVLENYPDKILKEIEKGPEHPINDEEIKTKLNGYLDKVVEYLNEFKKLDVARFAPRTEQVNIDTLTNLQRKLLQV